MTGSGRRLRGAVLALVLAGLVLPILAGLAETLRTALMADAGMWRTLAAMPGLTTSLRLTLVTGFGATLLSLVLAAALAAFLHGRGGAPRVLAPLLAAPHAAVAIGLAFLMSPSGWIARLIAPLAGWDRPLDVATVNDPWGLALVVGLTVKEVPFLTLVLLSALAQLPVRAQVAAGRALGYGRGIVWVKVILPQVYPVIRLPVLVVLAFGLSVVDMALILGPSTPPTLAVTVLRAFSDPAPGAIEAASAAATVHGVLVLGAVGLWVAGERGVAVAGRGWLYRGGRGMPAEPGLRIAAAGAAGVLALGFLALTMLMVWSVAFRWPWPLVVPETLTLRAWAAPDAGWGGPLLNTLALGQVSTGLSLALAIAWLEAEDRGRMTRAWWAEALIYLPLMLPQIAFLYGLTVVFLRADLSPGFWTVAWGQGLFVFPYVMLALSDPWRAMDPRLARSAAALGSGPWRVLWRVKLPVLLRPLMTAVAVGFAVSVGLYLPTLFLGGGRIATLTTEAVTLASGSDRRLVGVLATLQAVLPMLAYAGALVIPALAWRHRRALAGAA